MKNKWLSIPTCLVGLMATSCGHVNTIYLSISEKGHELEKVLLGIKPNWQEPAKFNDLIEKYKSEGESRYVDFNMDDLNQPVVCNLKDISTSTSDRYKLYTLLDSDASNYDTILLYIHGGGYINNIIGDELSLIDNIAKVTNAKAYIPIYPLAPVDDYEKAFTFIKHVYELISTENKKIVIIGDSSGAGQAVAMIENSYNLGYKAPEKLILLSPWLDGEMKNKMCEEYEKKDCLLANYGLKEAAKYWAGTKHNVWDYQISPINGDLSFLPPTLTIVGDNELMYPDTMDFVKKLKKYHIKQQLVIGKGSMHDFAMYNNTKEGGWVLPEAIEAQKIICNFILE